MSPMLNSALHGQRDLAESVSMAYLAERLGAAALVSVSGDPRTISSAERETLGVLRRAGERELRPGGFCRRGRDFRLRFPQERQEPDPVRCRAGPGIRLGARLGPRQASARFFAAGRAVFPGKHRQGPVVRVFDGSPRSTWAGESMFRSGSFPPRKPGNDRLRPAAPDSRPRRSAGAFRGRPGAPPPASPAAIERSVLANGAVFLYANDPSSRVTSVEIFVRGGKAAVPAGKEGLASLTTRLALEITDSRKART